MLGVLRSGGNLAVQCKVRSGGKLDLGDIQRDVLAMRGLNRPLESIIIATTARRDAKLQLWAQEETVKLAVPGSITIWFWDDIEDELNVRIPVRSRFYGQTAFGGSSHHSADFLRSQLEQQEQDIDLTITKMLETAKNSGVDLESIENARWAIRGAINHIKDESAKTGSVPAEDLKRIYEGSASRLLEVLRRTSPEHAISLSAFLQDLTALSKLAQDNESLAQAIQMRLEDDPDDVNGWNELAKLLMDQGKFKEALQANQNGIDVCMRDELTLEIPVLFINRARILLSESNLPMAINYANQSLQRYSALGDLAGQLSCFRQLARIHLEMHDQAACERYLESSIAIAREMNDLEELSTTNLYYAASLINFGRGDHAENKAESLIREAISIQKSRGNTDGLATALGNLASLLVGQERYDEADKLLAEAFAVARLGGDPQTLLPLYHTSARSHMQRIRLPEAEASLVAMIETAVAVSDSSAMCSGLILLSEVALFQNHFEKSYDAATTARSIAVDIDRPQSIARCSLALARIALSTGRIQEAETMANQAIKEFREIGMEWMSAAAIEVLNTCALIRGKA